MRVQGSWLCVMFFPLVFAFTGIIRDGQCDKLELDRVNMKLRPLLNELVKTTFFKFYRVNLFKECPFWKNDNMCSNHNCAVEVESDDDIPIELHDKRHLLNDVDFSHGKAFGVFQKCMYSEKDFCLVDNDLQQGSYVNLLKNPERFTGYAGDSAAKVWKAIYEENCFDIDEYFHMHHTDLSHDGCKEKRIFYKLISGLHASISAHICQDWYNEKSKTWEINAKCFNERLINHPDRIENMYFTFLVLIRSVSKLDPYLKKNAFCDDTDDWKITRNLVQKVTKALSDCRISFDESELFKEESFKLEFRDRFRNISAIMDCVSCQKCRLWGKIQTMGLGTALKVLFSFGDKPSQYQLSRTEMVSLLHSFNRLSESVENVQSFLQAQELQDKSEDDEIKKIKEKNQQSAVKVQDTKKINPQAKQKSEELADQNKKKPSRNEAEQSNDSTDNSQIKKNQKTKEKVEHLRNNAAKKISQQHPKENDKSEYKNNRKKSQTKIEKPKDREEFNKKKIEASNQGSEDIASKDVPKFGKDNHVKTDKKPQNTEAVMDGKYIQKWIWIGCFLAVIAA